MFHKHVLLYFSGSCLRDQLPCGRGENDCYDKNKRCDETWDCRQHGGDEISCGRFHFVVTVDGTHLAAWFSYSVKFALANLGDM